MKSEGITDVIKIHPQRDMMNICSAASLKFWGIEKKAERHIGFNTVEPFGLNEELSLSYFLYFITLDGCMMYFYLCNFVTFVFFCV